VTTNERARALDSAVAPSFEADGGSASWNYERYFVPAIGAPLAGDLVDVAGISAGDRVLDVACGTGVVARRAAERVGPAGSVTGLDINPDMLAVARSVMARTEAPIAWLHAGADATTLPGGAYDAVVCQLGLQFFPDPPVALRELHRVLAPDGRFASSTPGPTPRLFAVLEEALRDHVSAEAASFVQVVFRLDDREMIRDLLADAGFADVAVHRRAYELRLPAPTEFLWQYVWSTPLAGPVAQLDDTQRAAFERDVVTEWARLPCGETLFLDLDVVYATGRVRGNA
jgi:ubiquinone/menaquinone biosynthesis C-methylase UbiE